MYYQLICLGTIRTELWIAAKARSHQIFFSYALTITIFQSDRKIHVISLIISYTNLIINFKIQYCFQNYKTFLKVEMTHKHLLPGKVTLLLIMRRRVWRVILLIYPQFCLICYLCLVNTFPQTRDELSYCLTMNSY